MRIGKIGQKKEGIKMNISQLHIDKNNEGISLSHLNDVKQCHIMTSSYGEVIGCSLNKTEVKRIIKWLQKWVDLKEGVKNE